VSTVLLATLVLLGPACSVTEVVLAIDSDLAVPGELDAVRIEVMGSGSNRVFDTTVPLSSAADLPLTHSVVPAGGSAFEVVATGLRDGAEVVRDDASSGWIEGESRLLPLWLGRECMGYDCGEGRTCSGIGCVSRARPAADLAPFEGVFPRFDLPNRACARSSEPLVCEDFEAGLESWMGPLGEGTAEIVTDRSRGPGRSLRVHIDGPSERAEIMRELPELSAGSELHLRFFVYLEAGAEFANFNLVTLDNAASDGQIDFQGQMATRVGYYVGRELVPPMGRALGPDPDRVLPTDRWSCVELAIAIDPASGGVSYSIDGTVWRASTGFPTTNGAPISSLRFGISWSNASQPALTFWLDDLVVGDEPIGC
jgi:hypothetical protein